MKYVLVIGDGMTDNPVPRAGGKTPLGCAKIPNLDAPGGHRGEVGAVTNCPKRPAPGSDTAILSIFGNDPGSATPDAPPLEAAPPASS